MLGGRARAAPARDDRLPAAAAQLRRRACGSAGVDIVRLGLDGDRWGVPLPWAAAQRAAPARDERVREVIELVGATRYAAPPIGEFSGGEQQRLLIAQALVRRPRLLLLDEPLDSLDLPNQAAVAALIARICRERGRDGDAGRPRREPDPARTSTGSSTSPTAARSAGTPERGHHRARP